MSAAAIATPEQPLRCSYAATLQGCVGLWALRAFGRDSAGQAAHNGSAVSRAVELWHAIPDRSASAEHVEHVLARVEAERERWSLYEQPIVRAWTEGYVGDPRNGPRLAGEVRCEVAVSVALAPSEDDPTGQPVCLRGTLDQVRRARPGEPWYVWDLKSGRAGGMELAYQHLFQLGVYALAHHATTGEPTLLGGVIRLRGYDGKAGGGLHATHYPYLGSSPEALSTIAGEVAAHVARLRRGEVMLQPGAHCQYCPAGNPLTCARDVAAIAEITL